MDPLTPSISSPSHTHTHIHTRHAQSCHLTNKRSNPLKVDHQQPIFPRYPVLSLTSHQSLIVTTDGLHLVRVGCVTAYYVMLLRSVYMLHTSLIKSVMCIQIEGVAYTKARYRCVLAYYAIVLWFCSTPTVFLPSMMLCCLFLPLF